MAKHSSGMVFLCFLPLLVWLLCPGASFIHGLRSSLRKSPEPPARALPALRAARGRRPTPISEGKYSINENIRYSELRLTSVANGKIMEETNEVVHTDDALRRARDLGLDLVLTNENTDPPLAVIADVGKYTYQEAKKEKTRAREQKVPKVKEIKLTYTVGDHDLMTKIKRAEGWFKNERQQVRVTIQMKGRAKQFQQQARDVLERVARECAAFATVSGAYSQTGVPIQKDKKGDLSMLLVAGADGKLLKEFLNSQEGEEEDEEDEEEEEEEEEEGDKFTDPVLQELWDDLKEIEQDLKDCGKTDNQIKNDDDYKEALADFNRARAKIRRSAVPFIGAGGAGVLPAASFTLAAASLMSVRLFSLQARRR